MNRPKISVIVTCYNLEKYIEECLDSITNQTFQDFECIIVNDGSTDNTAKVISKYVKKDSRFKLIEKEHGGVSTARNIGFDVANGEYVIFLDGDDFFSSKLIGQMHRKISKESADIVVCNYNSYYDSMKKYGPSLLNFSRLNKNVVSFKDLPDDIFSTFTLMFWNKMFRADFLRDHALRNDESLHRAQDVEFIGRALVAAENITYITDTLVSYRTDTGSSNVSRLHQYPYDVIRAFEKLKVYLDENNMYKNVEKSYVKVAFTHVLANLYFTETSTVHHEIYDRAKQFFTDNKIVLDSDLLTGDAKMYNEVRVLLSEGYESWLRFRIADLRDDGESKYISYLLGEFQRKYKDEVDKNVLLRRQYDDILQSTSWRVTHPLRRLKSVHSRATSMYRKRHEK